MMGGNDDVYLPHAHVKNFCEGRVTGKCKLISQMRHTGNGEIEDKKGMCGKAEPQRTHTGIQTRPCQTSLASLTVATMSLASCPR
jgi:hypothetical protein